MKAKVCDECREPSGDLAWVSVVKIGWPLWQGDVEIVNGWWCPSCREIWWESLRTDRSWTKKEAAWLERHYWEVEMGKDPESQDLE